VDVKIVVPTKQIESIPLIIPALAGVVTVIVLVAIAFGHPPEPIIV
jgi:hypothetical protein